MGQHRPGAVGRRPALQYPVVSTIIWTIAITAVMAPLALRAFRRRTGG